MHDYVDISREIENAQSYSPMRENDLINWAQTTGFVYKNMCSNYSDLMKTARPRVERNTTYKVMGLRREMMPAPVLTIRGIQTKDVPQDTICCIKDGRCFEIVLRTDRSTREPRGQMLITEVEAFDDMTHIPKEDDYEFTLEVKENGHFGCDAFEFNLGDSQRFGGARAKIGFFREIGRGDHQEGRDEI
jgi:hypothetical protein